MRNLLLKAFLLLFAFNLLSATLLKKEEDTFHETSNFSTIPFLDENGFYIYTDIPANKQYVMSAYGGKSFVIGTTNNAVSEQGIVSGTGSLSLDANNNPSTICSASGLELACGAGNCPSPYPDIGAYPIVNGRDNNYAVFIGGDLNITGGKEIEGKSFVFGDFNFLNPGGAYNAGYVGLGSGVVPDANTVWVTVGGDLNTNGTTFLAAGDTGSDAGEGTVVVKGTADPNDFIADNGELVVDPTLDLSIYDACFATINTQSQCWAGETSSPNGTYVDDGFGSYNFTSTDGASGLYVFNIADDMGAGLAFSGAANFTGFPNDATILINVDKTGSSDNVTLNIGSFNGLTDELRQRIIWNFPDTENLTIEGGSQFWGSLVIPSRTSFLNLLEVPGFNGRLMAGGDVAHVAAGSEFHNYSFEGDLSSIACQASCTNPTADVPTTAQGTCAGSTANNDATITLNNITNADIAGIVAGADYTSGVAYNADASTNSALEAVAANTVTFSGLAHNTQYTVRVFNAANDCFTDFTVTSASISCMSASCALAITTAYSEQVICSGDVVDTLAVTTTFSHPDSIAFVYFTTAQTDSSIIYTGGTGIDTVQITNGNDTVTITNVVFPTNTSTTPIIYYLYAVAHPSPSELTCRPYEEILVTVNPCDWGDLPDTSATTNISDYQTLSANNGPVHVIIPGLSLGSSVDGEIDGQASTNALGDGNDEDGLTILASLDISPGGNFRIPLNYVNTTGNTAHIEAWIDWNGDGDFEETGEMVFNESDTGDTAFDRIPISVPSNAVTGQFLGLRIRISNQDNMTPYGLISTGEVEDYLIDLDCPTQICLPITTTLIRK